MISLFCSNNNVAEHINELSLDDVRCVTDFGNSFSGDQIRLKNEDYILILEGVILNKSQIEHEHKGKDWPEMVLGLYKEKGNHFFTDLRGSFVGALYDRKENKWIVFRDPLGGIPLYYSTTSTICVSTSIKFVYNYLQDKGISLKLDTCGVRMVLDLGFGMTIDDRTICSQVRKVHPCCCLVYKKGTLSEEQFYRIQKDELHLSSENEYIEMIDEAYKEAVRRQFGKDDEYGYNHVTCLSGGVDSRMMVWISHLLGWKKQLNITFSNSGWYDETTARRIAKDLNHEWLFKPLDDANFMYRVDEATQITGGNRAFYGLMHMRSLTSLINFEGANLGMLHTGSQGEILKGEAVIDGELNKNKNFYLGYLEELEITPSLNYSDPETCAIMNKYLQIDQGNSMSPLLELDFFETTLKVPSALRKDEYLYKKWVNKYPEANKYIWSTTGLPYGSKKFNPRLPKIDCYLYQLPKYIKYKFGGGGYLMNPFNAFYKANKELKTFYDTYAIYLEAIEDENIRNRVRENFYSENIMQRMKAVSILSAIKLFFHS